MKSRTTLLAFALAPFLLLAVVPSGGEDAKFRAELSGDQEVPSVDSNASGDFRIRFEDDFSSATFRLRVNDGERITQAHLHCGEEGMNGPVIVFLFGFHDRGWDLDGKVLDDITITDANIVNDACGTTLEEIAEAMADGRVYVNVHSVANPSGEIRGQLED